MADYIDRQAVVDVICAMHIGGKDGVANALPNTYGADLREIIEQIDSLPSADVQPVRHGVWMEENRRPRSAMFYCSECHRTAYDIQPTRDKTWAKRCRYAYCPNCGARMDGE